MPNIIGTAPNQVPTNSDLGSLAFQNKEAVNVDLIKLNTAGATAGTNQTVGTLSWDDGNGTANIVLKGGNVNLQVGQEILARVYNDSGVALTDGQVVYISGSQGNRIAVKLANASSEATSAGTLGVVTEPIAIGAEGFITMVGTVNGLNTTGLTAGNLIYLSATTPGAYTTTAPTAPNHRVILGYVERVHATVGSIYVKVDNGYELDELHNVVITTPSSGQVLKYNGTTWVNGDAASGGSLVYLSTTPASGTSVTITSGFSSTYDDYVVFADNIKTGGSGNLYLRGRFAGTIATANYYSTYTTGAAVATSTGSDRWNLSATTWSEGSLQVNIYGANLASSIRTMSFSGSKTNTAVFGGGSNTETGVLDGLQFYFSDSAAFTAGTFRLYGIKKT